MTVETANYIMNVTSSHFLSSVCLIVVLHSAASSTLVQADAQRCCQDAGERVEAGLLHHVVVLQHLPALLLLLLLFPRPTLCLLQ